MTWSEVTQHIHGLSIVGEEQAKSMLHLRQVCSPWYQYVNEDPSQNNSNFQQAFEDLRQWLESYEAHRLRDTFSMLYIAEARLSYRSNEAGIEFYSYINLYIPKEEVTPAWYDKAKPRDSVYPREAHVAVDCPRFRLTRRVVMQPFQQRVIDEKAQLDAKMEKLDHFLDSETFFMLPEDEQHRLVDQYDAMDKYSEILRQRINHFNEVSNEPS